MKTKTLITGATGLLGTPLSIHLLGRGYDVLRFGRSKEADVNANLLDRPATHAIFDRFQPDFIINLAALTNVDACETHPNAAYEQNVKTTETIVDWILANPGAETKLISFSTDQVYEGSGNKTEDSISLSNVYAFSKYCGELVASKVKATNLRTNFFGRSSVSGRESLSDFIVGRLLQKAELRLVSDIYFSPLSIPTLVEMVDLVLQNPSPGTFNLGSHEGTSKSDFGLALAHLLGLSTQEVQIVESKAFQFKANRPKDMRMDVSLFESTFKVKLPSLSAEINRVRRDYES